MNRCKTGSVLGIIIVLIVIFVIFSAIAHIAGYLIFGPIFRNIIPLIIGGFVGYWIGRNKG